MKVILKKTNKIEDVSFGYAVNYLIPHGLALKATPEAIKKLESKTIFQEKTKKEKVQKDENLADELNHRKITIKAKSSKSKKTFNSVGKKQILNALKLTKNQVEVLLDKPIKELGKYKVELKIGGRRAIIELEVVKEKI